MFLAMRDFFSRTIFGIVKEEARIGGDWPLAWRHDATISSTMSRN